MKIFEIFGNLRQLFENISINTNNKQNKTNFGKNNNFNKSFNNTYNNYSESEYTAKMTRRNELYNKKLLGLFNYPKDQEELENLEKWLVSNAK